MANGEITRALIDCLEGNNINSSRFFSLHPQTSYVKSGLYELRKRGYITIDEGDDRIIEMAPTQKLIDLSKEV